jgi:hypothetical protein
MVEVERVSGDLNDIEFNVPLSLSIKRFAVVELPCTVTLPARVAEAAEILEVVLMTAAPVINVDPLSVPDEMIGEISVLPVRVSLAVRVTITPLAG